MAVFCGYFSPIDLPESSKDEYRIWCECHAIFMTKETDWKYHCDFGTMEYDCYWTWHCPNCEKEYRLNSDEYANSYKKAFNKRSAIPI